VRVLARSSSQLVVVLLVAGCGGSGNGPAGSGGRGGSGGEEVAPDAASPAVAGRAGADAAPVTGGVAGADAAGAAGTGGSSGADTGVDLAADSAPVVVPGDSVVWNIDNLQMIGGFKTTVRGAPMVIDTPGGKAVQFDGNGDALLVDKHPLAGLAQFTVEIIFRPDPGGAPAQRWFHMEETGGGRVLFETRLFGNSFAQDVFVESKGGNVALYDAKSTHPLGAWYHVAAVVDGKRAHHYVNGMEESNVALNFQAHGPGRTAIGMRINERYFFKGAIRQARFTPRVLTPAEFMKLN
jgi:hypothetical protein